MKTSVTGADAAPSKQVDGTTLTPEALLYDQNNNASATGNVTSQNFEAAFDAYDAQDADDFIVSASGWTVTNVLAPGTYSAGHTAGTSPTSIHLQFFQDNAGFPGASICDFPTAAFVEAPVGTFNVTAPGGCVLTAGPKWVSVQVNMNFNGGGGQWFWNSRTVQSNNGAAWQNPGGGFPGTGCPTWGRQTACLGATDPDQLFTISGSINTCTVDADCADGNLCNGVETCVNNACVPGTTVICNDGLQCTIDTCITATGQCNFAPNPCSDGDGCTVDSCDEVNGCSHVTAPPVQFCNNSPIAIVDVAGATPYPSNIVVAGLGTSASLCSVQLNGITHTWPDDIDMLLVGPVATSQNAEIMSDVGGSADVTGLNLTLKDAAATSLPDAGPLVAGTFKPTNAGGVDVFPAPAPVTTGASALTAFSGNPNGTWKLYVRDQFAGDTGSMTGWCINLVVAGCSQNSDCNDGNLCNGVEACVNNACVPGTPVDCNDNNQCTLDGCTPATGQCTHDPNPCNDNDGCTLDSCDIVTGCAHQNVCVQFCNQASITITDTATPPTAATPYPSPIVVSGMGASAVVGNVKLLGINHTFPDDIDILLVGPAGGAQNAIIMSDVGGGAPGAVNVSLTLDDSATASIPDGGPLASGTFKPTNVSPGTGTETYPAPAPAPAGGSALSVFTGNLNGTWNLFVVDDQGADSGTMTGGWCVNIRTACTVAGDCDDQNACTVDTCTNGTCGHSILNCDDNNPCTTDTCDPGSGCINTPVPPPADINDSVRVTKTGSVAHISWTDPPGPYNVYRGSRIGTTPWSYNHTCKDSMVAASTVDDAAILLDGDYYYLVSRDNGCAESRLGFASNGNPIPNSSPCP